MWAAWPVKQSTANDGSSIRTARLPAQRLDALLRNQGHHQKTRYRVGPPPTKPGIQAEAYEAESQTRKHTPPSAGSRLREPHCSAARTVAAGFGAQKKAAFGDDTLARLDALEHLDDAAR
jgi:hypothetical protein